MIAITGQPGTGKRKTTPTRREVYIYIYIYIYVRRVGKSGRIRPGANAMMVEVKFYLSRVLAPVGDFRVSPWNFDGGPHADTPAHYPSALAPYPLRRVGFTITCFEGSLQPEI